jgi:hypothetical protein
MLPVLGNWSAAGPAKGHDDLRLLVLTLRYYGLLTREVLRAPITARRRAGGAVLILLGLPFFLLWQALQWLGFLLDEFFFRSYRKVRIRQPIFIVGPPRTGTTHLHHVLSQSNDMTTFKTWECLFALSVTARKFWLGAGQVDRLLGRPLGRLLGLIGKRVQKSMDDIHPMSLNDPEEDFLCMLPIAACFLLVVPFPRAAWLWKFARFDVEVPVEDKRVLLRYYEACIKKHLYVFGSGKQFLSKNASFSGMAEALLETFPDARLLVTTRDPVKAVPSQLSSLRPGLAVCGFTKVDDHFRDQLADLLLFYFEHLADVAQSHPDRVAVLYNKDLHARLAESVADAMASVGLTIDDNMQQKLQTLGAASRAYRSTHRYSLDDFALDEAAIQSRFATVYSRYNFA